MKIGKIKYSRMGWSCNMESMISPTAIDTNQSMVSETGRLYSPDPLNYKFPGGFYSSFKIIER